MVDAHSKWIEAHVLWSSTSTAMIERLFQTFATHSVPQVQISDNGSSFMSTEFAEFMDKNAIKHIRSAPYYPATCFLFAYRTTPHAVTGVVNAQLLMKCHLHSRLDAIRPDMKTKVNEKIVIQQNNVPRQRNAVISSRRCESGKNHDHVDA